jgi:hypothetical protein
MHGFVKKGLLITLASGALVLGGAASALADTATANGSTSQDAGLVDGNVAQVAGDNPINICGDAGAVAAANDGSKHNFCVNTGNSAAINGATTEDSGAASGNVIGAALDAPINACGVDVQALGAKSGAYDNSCENVGTMASANGATHDDEGLLSGNVLQLAENAPINACGDSIGIGDFGSPAADNHCSNS